MPGPSSNFPFLILSYELKLNHSTKEPQSVTPSTVTNPNLNQPNLAEQKPTFPKDHVCYVNLSSLQILSH